MKTKLALSAALGTLCLITLSACSETTNQGASLQPSGSMTSNSFNRTANPEDERACLSAVAAQVDSSVTVLSSETSEANNLVMVGVGPQQAPWRCLISNGRVVEVMFAGSEGAL